MAFFELEFFRSFFHTKKNAIPIKINSIVQTGPNTKDGGVKEGLIRELYQIGIEGVVKKDPIYPARRGTKIDMINFIIIFLFIITQF